MEVIEIALKASPAAAFTVAWCGRTFVPSRDELETARRALELGKKADVLARDDAWTDAIANYLDAAKLNSKDPILHMSIGVCYYQLGELERAHSFCQKAKQLAPAGYPETARIERNLAAVEESRALLKKR